MKFNVTADLDWVSGHLRYGHLEGIVDVESEEELDALIESGDIKHYLDLVVDDYEVDDCADPEKYEFTRVD